MLVFVVLAALVSVWGSPLLPSVGMLHVQFSAILKVFIEKEPFFVCYSDLSNKSTGTSNNSGPKIPAVRKLFPFFTKHTARSQLKLAY